VKKYSCYGAVTGTKYIGEVFAENKKDAIEKAFRLDKASVALCHQCSSECEDAEIHEINVEEQPNDC